VQGNGQPQARLPDHEAADFSSGATLAVASAACMTAIGGDAREPALVSDVFEITC
jgi:hypothetical protein